MSYLIEFIQESWMLAAEMAPYLILGFLIAGLLSVLIKEETIRKWLGRKGAASVFWGSILGVPLPLCSCGVIPVSSSLYRRGASKGATISFLTSTPQTGVDSIAATAGMISPFFAVVRVVVALISGIASGLIVNLLDKTPNKTKTPSPESDEATPPFHPLHTSLAALKYGFYTLPADLGKNLTIGLLLAALLGVVIPDNWFSQFLDKPWLTYGAVTLIAVPLYVCSTGSIPIAFSLLAAGVSPGAALVFLIAGPATNVATITTLSRVLGKQTMVIYLAMIILFSWAAGAILDTIPSWQNLAFSNAHHHETGIGILQHLSAAALLLMLIFPFIKNKLPIKTQTPAMNDKQITLHVSGMNCGHCSASLEKALKEVTGVVDAKADHQQERAWVEGENIDISALQQATEALGFQYKGQVD